MQGQGNQESRERHQVPQPVSRAALMQEDQGRPSCASVGKLYDPREAGVEGSGTLATSRSSGARAVQPACLLSSNSFLAAGAAVACATRDRSVRSRLEGRGSMLESSQRESSCGAEGRKARVQMRSPCSRLPSPMLYVRLFLSVCMCFASLVAPLLPLLLVRETRRDETRLSREQESCRRTPPAPLGLSPLFFSCLCL